MKPAHFLLSGVFVGCLSLAAQTSPAPATLTGIVDLPGYKCATLSVAGTRPNWPRTELILREGERVASVELLHILPERGAVELRVGGSNLMTVSLSNATNTSAGVPAIAFAGASLKSAMEVYSELANRSLLRSPLLPDQGLTFRVLAGDRAEAARILAAAFLTNGIAVIPDGDKFALVLRKEDVGFFPARSGEIKPTAADALDLEQIPAGSVNFMGADVWAAATGYARFSGREIDPANWSRDIPNPSFFFRNQAPLTTPEMRYAFERLFELCGLKMVPDGEKFLKPVRLVPKPQSKRSAGL